LKGAVIFAQGDAANAVFYMKSGTAKLVVVSQQGKEAIVAIFSSGQFFGEGCLVGPPRRLGTAEAMTDCVVLRVEKPEVLRLIRDSHEFAQNFVSYVLTRTARVEEDLVDQLFNSTEIRLARVLLLLANFGKDGTPQRIAAKISQESLAEMIGTTRSRVSHFMNKFRRLGFIEYKGTIEVHSSLLSVVLSELPNDVRLPRQ
jgi:CRP-like cAMP-binding protein